MVTIEQIKKYVLEQSYHIKPDIVIMDYQDLILPSKAYLNNEIDRIDAMMRIFDRHTRRDLRRKKLERILKNV